jgi:hypothetical protein
MDTNEKHLPVDRLGPLTLIPLGWDLPMEFFGVTNRH